MPRALASFCRTCDRRGSGHVGKLLHGELVEWDRIDDFRRHEIVLEQELPLALLAQRDRPDRRHAERGELLGTFPLVPPLAAANPLPQDRPQVRDEEVLDIDDASREFHPVNDPMGARLDRDDPARLAPLVEPESFGTEQDVAPARVLTHPPADLSEWGPFPFRRLEDARDQLGIRSGTGRLGRRDREGRSFLRGANTHRSPTGLRLGKYRI